MPIEITYITMKFHTSRPLSFGLYKKTSQNSNWEPYQFYSDACQRTYGKPNSNRISGTNKLQVLCTGDFSDIAPLTGGDVSFSTLKGRYVWGSISDSPALQVPVLFSFAIF